MIKILFNNTESKNNFIDKYLSNSIGVVSRDITPEKPYAVVRMPDKLGYIIQQLKETGDFKKDIVGISNTRIFMTGSIKT